MILQIIYQQGFMKEIHVSRYFQVQNQSIKSILNKAHHNDIIHRNCNNDFGYTLTTSQDFQFEMNYRQAKWNLVLFLCIQISFW